MQQISKHLLTAGVLAFSAAGVQAQYGPPPEAAYSAHWVSGVVDHVHRDLNRAYQSWHVTDRDRRNLDHAEHELRDFAQKWDRGRFNKGELDEAIGAIQHVVDNNHMPEGERNSLIDDLGQLRGMRQAYDHHEIGGYR